MLEIRAWKVDKEFSILHYVLKSLQHKFSGIKQLQYFFNWMFVVPPNYTGALY